MEENKGHGVVLKRGPVLLVALPWMVLWITDRGCMNGLNAGTNPVEGWTNNGWQDTFFCDVCIPPEHSVSSMQTEY